MYDASKLWGMADKSSPLTVSSAECFIREQLGRDTIGGLTSYSDKFRDAFRRSTYVPESGAIPAEEKVSKPMTCAQKHIGLCMHRDGEHFHKLHLFALRMQKWVVANASEADDLKLTISFGGDMEPICYYFAVAYIRKARPEIVIAVPSKKATEAGLLLPVDDEGMSGSRCPPNV
jgi:hypothetical protein